MSDSLGKSILFLQKVGEQRMNQLLRETEVSTEKKMGTNISLQT